MIILREGEGFVFGDALTGGEEVDEGGEDEGAGGDGKTRGGDGAGGETSWAVREVGKAGGGINAEGELAAALACSGFVATVCCCC